MLSLPVYNKTDERFRLFGSAQMPLRPSALGKLVACPMSAFLSYSPGNDLGNKAAQTGNLVHAAVAEYHRKVADVAAGQQALAAAREQFPDGDWKKAEKIYGSYVADPVNQNAKVLWVEHPVRIEIECPGGGLPIVIEGTLDQVRLDTEKRVWDIKTGDAKTAAESVDEYLVQQAAYVLNARDTLDPDILPGGIIYTPGYEKPRGKVHLPLKLTVEACKMLMLNVAYAVSLVRQGIPLFRPSADACRWCPVRPYTHCFSMFHGAYT